MSFTAENSTTIVIVTLLLCLSFFPVVVVCSQLSSSSTAAAGLHLPSSLSSREQYESSHVYHHQPSSSSSVLSSLMAMRRRNAAAPSSPSLSLLPSQQLSSLPVAFSLQKSMLLSLRGGDIAFSDDEETDDGDGDDESIVDFSDDEDTEDDDDEDTEDESEEEEEEESDEEEDVASTPLSSSPVKVIIRTGLKNSLLDQSIELTCSRKRDVASLKTSVSKQMRGRPPPSTLTLLHHNRILMDDELVDEIAPDEDDDDDDFAEDDDDDDDDMVKLYLMLDNVPPIDPKFATELPERMEKMSDSELLDAYVTNVIAMQRNHEQLLKTSLQQQKSEDQENDDNDSEENEEETTSSSSTTISLPESVSMRMDAMTMRERMMENFPQDVVQKLMMDEDKNKENGNAAEGESAAAASGGVHDASLVESIKRKGRNKNSMAIKRGGATMNVKRSLQRNLNINWPDTIRNFFLFLFFGYFGGRNTASRTLMLLCAPMCFIIQARPVKIALKQLFYAVGKPPSIFLSLLPAPQQAIMSLDYSSALVDLYGEEIAKAAADAMGVSLNMNNDEDDGGIEEDEDDDYDGDDDEEFDSDEYDDEDDY